MIEKRKTPTRSKICENCSASLVLGDRHKLCTKCRFKTYRTPCKACGELIQRAHKMCISCFNKSDIKSVIAGKTPKKWTSNGGYVMVYVPGHPRNKSHVIQEHVLIMEKSLGRYLFAGENVHHINGIKNDNRLENLELWCKPQPSGVRAEDVYCWALEIINRYDDLFGSSKD